jgi:hydroxylamine reductase (hybrid-cluster protein)
MAEMTHEELEALRQEILSSLHCALPGKVLSFDSASCTAAIQPMLKTRSGRSLPRLMDVGQCNDAFSAIKIAVALAEAFGCGVNDLPLSMVLSWYEQKAVCILLTLLHLGITNIKLGPTLPAFVSPNVLAFLVEKFQIAPTTTPEADLAELLGA